MKKFLSIICAATMAFTGVAATSVTASASPALIRAVDMGATSGNANVVDVQYHRDNRRELRRDRRELRQDRREVRQDRREIRRDVRQANRGFYRQGNNGYYNGHRGYRERRSGYRQHNGYWFPAAAFIAGAIAGGAIAQPAPQRVIVQPGHMSQAHVNWCANQYRSYRVSDNSFQPYNGPRRGCSSPYS